MKQRFKTYDIIWKHIFEIPHFVNVEQDAYLRSLSIAFPDWYGYRVFLSGTEHSNIGNYSK